MHRRWFRLLCAWMASLLPVAADGSVPAITPAEKAACEIVADHLARGARAFQERLSAESEFAGLKPDRQLLEIEARVGPHEGAYWQLRTAARDFAEHGAVFSVTFPSGLEDVVSIELENGKGGWSVRDIRTLAEVSPEALPIAPVRQQALSGMTRLIVPFLLLAPLLSLGGAILRPRARATSSALLTAALLVFLACFGTIIDPGWTRLATVSSRLFGGSGNESKSGTRPLELAEIAQLRRTLAQGVASAPLSSSLPPIASEVVILWRASMELGIADDAEIQARLQRLTFLSQAPLAHLLRARLASIGGTPERARQAYAALRAHAPSHDAHALEEWLALDARSREIPTVTRDSSLYYLTVVDRLVNSDDVAVRRAFQTAWSQQPVPRETLIASRVFGMLVGDPGLAALVGLNRPKEAVSTTADFARSPMRLPAGAEAVVNGGHLRIEIGGAVLDAPGGASMASSSTAKVSAEEFARRNASAALRAVEQLRSPSLTSIAMQQTVEAAADVLAERNGWSRIAELTQVLRPESETTPLSLVVLRTKALVRLNRFEEARALAAGRAVLRASLESDAAPLLELGELMAATGRWDEAKSLVRQASQAKNAPDVSAILVRMELREQLAGSAPLTTTPHFAIHATPDVSVTVTERVAQILEAELTRLRGELRTEDLRPLRVNVTRWDEFSEKLTGSDHVVGFYDGGITVPFGEVARFRDGVVSVLTHELTHAIVAQQSNDNAPRWFQEGLATRMELVERQANIFQKYRDRDFIALSLLDATLKESLDPEAVADAYTTAGTLIRFLEDRYGSDAVPRLIRTFGEGKDTGEALQTVLGVSGLADLDVEFRSWGITNAEAFLDPRPWPYMKYYSPGIDPAIRNAIRFSRRPEAGKP
jgi:hypothetical protein